MPTNPESSQTNGTAVTIPLDVKSPINVESQSRDVSTSAKKSRPKKKKKEKPEAEKRSRTVRPFPSASFQDSLLIGQTMQKMGAVPKVRRLTLFEHLNKSPDSGPSRQLITNSGSYGITSRSYAAEFIELTADGRTATDPEATCSAQLSARFKLAIEQITWFVGLYSTFAGQKLPAMSVTRDHLAEMGLDKAWLEECASTFTVNCKYLGLLREIAGAERLVKLDHALEEAAKGQPPSIGVTAEIEVGVTASASNWQKKCFYITPIGKEGSEPRKHADLFMSALVEPAIAPLGLDIVRADHIGKPGMITSQIFEHLKHCRLAIADMSLGNQSVFYEMALRHALRLPIIQITRKADDIPFDVNQVRTVVVDTSDIYTLVPKLEIYRSEIQTQARGALEDPAGITNPITVFYPDFFK